MSGSRRGRRRRRRTFGDIVAGLVATALLVLLIVGVPVALVQFFGSPIPSEVPSLDALTGPVGPGTLMTLLSVLVWLAWVQLVVCVAVELWAGIRGVGVPARVPLSGGPQALAHRLVASALLLVTAGVVIAPVFTGKTGSASPGPPAPRTPATSSPEPSATPSPSPTPGSPGLGAPDPRPGPRLMEKEKVKKVYKVRPPHGRHHESLWEIAEKCLGDGRRYKDIFELNKGREQPDGARLTIASLIRPGWILDMPADAVGTDIVADTAGGTAPEAPPDADEPGQTPLPPSTPDPNSNPGGSGPGSGGGTDEGSGATSSSGGGTEEGPGGTSGPGSGTEESSGSGGTGAAGAGGAGSSGSAGLGGRDGAGGGGDGHAGGAAEGPRGSDGAGGAGGSDDGRGDGGAGPGDGVDASGHGADADGRGADGGGGDGEDALGRGPAQDAERNGDAYDAGGKVELGEGDALGRGDADGPGPLTPKDNAPAGTPAEGDARGAAALGDGAPEGGAPEGGAAGDGVSGSGAQGGDGSDEGGSEGDAAGDDGGAVAGSAATGGGGQTGNGGPGGSGPGNGPGNGSGGGPGGGGGGGVDEPRVSLPARELAAASLLAASVLTALGRRRRLQLWRRAFGRRLPAPEAAPARTEVDLRMVADHDAARLLDLGLRQLSQALAAEERPLPTVYAAHLAAEGLNLWVAVPDLNPPAPWQAMDDGQVWRLPADAAVTLREEALAGVLAPYPGLVTIGSNAAGLILVDLEVAHGPIRLRGPAELCRAVLAGIAVELATNGWSDHMRITLVGFGSELTALAPDRVRCVDTLGEALPELEARAEEVRHALDALGVDSVLTGRARGQYGEAWMPHYLIMAAPPDGEDARRLADLAPTAHRMASGYLIAGDVDGATWTFEVAPGGRLNTGVLGLEVDAQLVPPRMFDHVVALFKGADEETVPAGDDDEAAVSEPSAPDGVPALEIRLLGSPEVTGAGELSAERRTLLTELVVFLAVHPEGVHPTVLTGIGWPRGVQAEVRDAALARLAEWLGRDSRGWPNLTEDSAGRLRLGPEVRVDWLVARWLLRRARARRTDAAEEMELLARAVGMIRGPLLDGRPAGRYAWLAADDLEYEVTTALADAACRLAELRTAAGDPDGAVAAARTGLQLAGYDAELWRALLRATHAAGDEAAVRTVVEELYAWIERDPVLHAPPSQTQALIEELLPTWHLPEAG